MSTQLAIAGVSLMLRKRVRAAIDPLPAVMKPIQVVTVAPDRAIGQGLPTENTVILFLHHVSFNPALRNRDLPARDANGALTANPLLALDLHYLLCAAGRAELETEVLLGAAMQALNETPVFSRDLIETLLEPPQAPSPLDVAIANSELGAQIEAIRVTPEPLAPDEMSKLWSALQSHYRVSTGYQASVVLIQGKRPVRSALPVRTRNVYALPIRLADIERIVATQGTPEHVFANSTIAVTGRELIADRVEAILDGVTLPAAQVRVVPSRIEVTLAPLPAGVYAGVKRLRFAYPLDIGTPPTPHRGTQSTVGVFVLRPRITQSAVAMTGTEIIDGVALRRGSIQFDVSPKVGRRQRVVMLLDQAVPPPPPAMAGSYTFVAEPGNGIAPNLDEAVKISVPFRRVLPGSYLVRLQIDDAESVLGPAAGAYTDPRVTIP